jgi:hypothetical protein
MGYNIYIKKASQLMQATLEFLKRRGNSKILIEGILRERKLGVGVVYLKFEEFEFK